jgi:hypothetical protein
MDRLSLDEQRGLLDQSSLIWQCAVAVHHPDLAALWRNIDASLVKCQRWGMTTPAALIWAHFHVVRLSSLLVVAPETPSHHAWPRGPSESLARVVDFIDARLSRCTMLAFSSILVAPSWSIHFTANHALRSHLKRLHPSTHDFERLPKSIWHRLDSLFTLWQPHDAVQLLGYALQETATGLSPVHLFNVMWGVFLQACRNRDVVLWPLTTHAITGEVLTQHLARHLQQPSASTVSVTSIGEAERRVALCILALLRAVAWHTDTTQISLWWTAQIFTFELHDWLWDVISCSPTSDSADTNERELSIDDDEKAEESSEEAEDEGMMRFALDERRPDLRVDTGPSPRMANTNDSLSIPISATASSPIGDFHTATSSTDSNVDRQHLLVPSADTKEGDDAEEATTRIISRFTTLLWRGLAHHGQRRASLRLLADTQPDASGPVKALDLLSVNAEIEKIVHDANVEVYTGVARRFLAAVLRAKSDFDLGRVIGTDRVVRLDTFVEEFTELMFHGVNDHNRTQWRRLIHLLALCHWACGSAQPELCVASHATSETLTFTRCFAGRLDGLNYFDPIDLQARHLSLPMISDSLTLRQLYARLESGRDQITAYNNKLKWDRLLRLVREASEAQNFSFVALKAHLLQMHSLLRKYGPVVLRMHN